VRDDKRIRPANVRTNHGYIYNRIKPLNFDVTSIARHMAKKDQIRTVMLSGACERPTGTKSEPLRPPGACRAESRLRPTQKLKVGDVPISSSAVSLLLLPRSDEHGKRLVQEVQASKLVLFCLTDSLMLHAPSRSAHDSSAGRGFLRNTLAFRYFR